MRTVKINAILLLLIIVCAYCSTAGAKEKKITKQIIKMAPREEIQTSGMCINDGGKACRNPCESCFEAQEKCGNTGKSLCESTSMYRS